MKNHMLSLFTALTLFTSLSANAATMNISQLSCMGLGAVNGYTTIRQNGANKVQVSSIKYFVTSSDENVTIIGKQILANGYVQLDLFSPAHRSSFSLILSGPVGPAQLVTTTGIDLLQCSSAIAATP